MTLLSKDEQGLACAEVHEQADLCPKPHPKQGRDGGTLREQEKKNITLWRHDCMPKATTKKAHLARRTALTVDNFGCLLHMQRGANASPLLERGIIAACEAITVSRGPHTCELQC